MPRRTTDRTRLSPGNLCSTACEEAAMSTILQMVFFFWMTANTAKIQETRRPHITVISWSPLN